MRIGLRTWIRCAAGLVFLSSLLCSATSFAGAWTKAPYHFYLQLGTSFSTADTRFNQAGADEPIRVKKYADPSRVDTSDSNFQQLLSDLYFEFGLFKRVTIFGDLPLSSMRQRNVGGDIVYSKTGYSDTLLGVRAGLLLDPVAIALEARMTAPSGDPNARIPTGSGDFRGELRLAIGKAFDRVPIYVDFEFGVTLRGTAELDAPTPGALRPLIKYAPEIAVHAEVGGVLLRWHGADRLLLNLAVDYRGSTVKSNGADALFTLLSDNSEFTTVAVALSGYAYHGFGVMGRFTQAVEGRRLPHTSTVSGALFVNY